MSNQSLHIRNSTAEFLIFTSQAQQDSIEVRVADETVWLTQKLIARLFGVSVSTVNEHLTTLIQLDEINPNRTIRNFRIVQTEGNRKISREVVHYNLSAIISIGFKINSERATEFRRWAISVLSQFAVRGYVLDNERLKNGAYLNQKYFDDLVSEIREIRASERNFYQKITDIYATALDYDASSDITKKFFASVQNKMHYAVHQHTAAELIVKRANHKKEHMGLTTWKKAPHGKIIKSDVSVAKNYLDHTEIATLNRVVTMYLDYAEDQAQQGIPMTMRDWAQKLDVFLQFHNKKLLQDAGTVAADVAQTFAESEFEKFRPLQDVFYESDFDRLVKASQLPE